MGKSKIIEPSIPLKRSQDLSIAIPTSIVEDTPHLREKTYKIGQIGRAASIFRVEQIMIYSDKTDNKQIKEADFIAAILNYMDIPQYLRKILVKIDPQLRFVGILPPLRSPHHLFSKTREELNVGMFRQGVVIDSKNGSSLVDIGVGKTAIIKENLAKRQRITVKLTSIGEKLNAVKLDESEIRIYWGFNVTVTKLPLVESTINKGFDLIISTSKYGDKITEVFPQLKSAWKKSKKALVPFGSPTQGLKEILTKESKEMSEYSDFTINMIPNQGVETVRSEEAIFSSLSLLNTLE
ncbi:putative RNA uridine N3 methyltransferase [[Eubacterium] cellulosolvens]